MLALPLLCDGRVIGALSLADAAGRTFDPEALALARLFADHAATALTAAVTLVAMAMSAALVREGRDPEDADTPGGQITFLGVLGLMVGAINLALILLEGSYAIFVDPCG